MDSASTSDANTLLHLPRPHFSILTWIVEYCLANNLESFVKDFPLEKIADSNPKIAFRFDLHQLKTFIQTESYDELPQQIGNFKSVVPSDTPGYWDILTQMKAQSILYYIKQEPLDHLGFNQAISVLTRTKDPGDDVLRQDMRQLKETLETFLNQQDDSKDVITHFLLEKYNTDTFREIFVAFIDNLEKTRCGTPFLEQVLIDTQTGVYRQTEVFSMKQLRGAMMDAGEDWNQIVSEKSHPVKKFLAGVKKRNKLSQKDSRVSEAIQELHHNANALLNAVQDPLDEIVTPPSKPRRRSLPVQTKSQPQKKQKLEFASVPATPASQDKVVTSGKRDLLEATPSAVTMEWGSDSESPVPKSLPKSEQETIARSSKRRRHFTDREVEFLVRGVIKFGLGKWSQILQYYDFGDRTAVDLKDKWRNLLKHPKELRNLIDEQTVYLQRARLGESSNIESEES